MIRDYRQATLDKLLAEIDSINRNNWSWFTDYLGDRWLKLGKALRLVSLEDDLSNLESYQRKVLDMNNTTKEELRQIFERVYEVDSSYSRHFDDLLQRQQYYNAKISKLTEMINPHFSIAPVATISEAVSGFNSEIAALSQNIVGEQLPNAQNDMLNPLGMIATGAVYSIFNKLFQADSDSKLNNVDSYPFPFDWSDDSLPTWVKEWGKAVDKKLYKDTQKTTLLKVIDAIEEKDTGKVFETVAKAFYKTIGKKMGFKGEKKYLLTYIWNATKYTTEAYVEYWDDPSLTNLLNCFWESTVGGILRTGAEEAYDVVAKIPFISDWYDKYGVENGNDMVNVAYTEWTRAIFGDNVADYVSSYYADNGGLFKGLVHGFDEINLECIRSVFGDKAADSVQRYYAENGGQIKDLLYSASDLKDIIKESSDKAGGLVKLWQNGWNSIFQSSNNNGASVAW